MLREDIMNNIGMYKETVLSEVNTASPHRLTQLLFERLMTDLNTAALFATNNDQRKVIENVSHAHKIVIYLHECLDMSDTSGLAERLSQIYTFVEKKLLLAHMRKNSACIAECIRIITPIKEGWDAIAEQV
jgi:flagellar secretion chaperone FliS